MTTYIFSPPTVEEAPEATHRLFQFWTLDRGITVVRTGTTYSTGRWFSQDELETVDEYWLGGHKHEVSEATREGLVNAGIGITTDNFTAI